MQEKTIFYMPVEVNGWVVNNKILENIEQNITIRRWQSNFTATSSLASPEQPPFLNGDTKTAMGVYLHWLLPNGLKHGMQTKEGVFKFPTVPDRWLIVRETLNPAQKKSWVIESNRLHAAGAPFPDPNYPQNNSLGQVFLGNVKELSAWVESSFPGSAEEKDFLPKNKPLTAVASGDIYFSSYQPYNKNIFSFYDELTGVDSATINYSIVGWYSDLNQDLLNQLKERMTSQQSIIEILKNDYFCNVNETEDIKQLIEKSRTFCAGSVNKIIWQKYGVPATDNYPQHINIAIGTTTLDAYAALLQEENTQRNNKLEYLFKALDHHLLTRLNDINSQEKIDNLSHQSTFGTTLSDVVWQIAPQDTHNSSPEYVQELLEQFNDELSELNKLQASCSRNERILKIWQSDLYAIWWKHNKSKHDSEISDYLKNYYDVFETLIEGNGDNSYTEQVKKLKKLINEQNNQIRIKSEELITKINSLQSKDKPKVLLKKSYPNPFWLPLEPVVLIEGLEPTPRPFGMLTECCFLEATSNVNPELSLRAKSDVLTPLMQKLTRQVAAVLQHVESLSNNSKQWQQPWKPLFIEWQVEWCPVDFSLWSFNGIDYALPTMPPALQKLQHLSGRTSVSPQANHLLKNHLKKLKKDNDRNDPLQKLQSEIDQLGPLLSHRLHGFYEQLVLHDNRPYPIPLSSASVMEVIGKDIFGLPLVGTIPTTNKNTLNTFQPLIAGQLRFRKLSVIDNFGQCKVLISERNIDDISLKISNHLRVSGDPNFIFYIELAPRFVQETRLVGEWLGSNYIPIDYLSNPVCGWVLLNHLDDALDIYNAEGVYLGAIEKLADIIIWKSPHNYKLDDFEVELAEFIKCFLDNDAKGHYQGFVETIQTALSGNSNFFSKTDHALTSCIGDPLALVRMGWRLEQAGTPYIDHSWASTNTALENIKQRHVNTNAKATPTVQEEIKKENGMSFPIHIGNISLKASGVIGYFTASENNAQQDIDFTCFYSDYKKTEYHNIKFIRGNEFKLSVGNENTKTVLLMLPQKTVYAYTGILPVYQIDLPEKFSEKLLKNLEVNFSMGPVLMPLTHTGEAGIPSPSVPGSWFWVEKEEVKDNADGIFYQFPLGSFTSKPQWGNHYQTTEGWLKLRLNTSFEQEKNQNAPKNKETPQSSLIAYTSFIQSTKNWALAKQRSKAYAILDKKLEQAYEFNYLLAEPIAKYLQKSSSRGWQLYVSYQNGSLSHQQFIAMLPLNKNKCDFSNYKVSEDYEKFKKEYSEFSPETIEIEGCLYFKIIFSSFDKIIEFEFPKAPVNTQLRVDNN